MSNKFKSLNDYVKYTEAQFIIEKRRYVVVKARGRAIESALQVAQCVKDDIGGLHMYTTFALQLTKDRSYPLYLKQVPREPTFNENYVDTPEKLEHSLAHAGSRLVPSVEVILSKIPLFEGPHPGHEAPHQRVKPIFLGPKTPMPKQILKAATLEEAPTYQFYEQKPSLITYGNPYQEHRQAPYPVYEPAQAVDPMQMRCFDEPASSTRPSYSFY